MSREQAVSKSTEVYKEEGLGMPLRAETCIRSQTDTPFVGGQGGAGEGLGRSGV